MMISAIVTCRDRPRHVERCLSALVSQTAKLGEDFEVILVEQGRASHRLAGMLPITYIELPYGRDINVPWLCNVGARRATGQYVYNIECDLILESEAIRKVIDIVHGGAFGLRTTGCFGDWRRSLNEEETVLLWRNRSLMPDETWGKTWNSKMTVLFSARYYAWLGGYDETFETHEYGFHDLDMIERVRATGEMFVLPILAWHQWHEQSWVWVTGGVNHRRFQRMRRTVRRRPETAVRNSGRWGLLDKLGQPETERAKLRPRMSRQERRGRRRGRA